MLFDVARLRASAVVLVAVLGLAACSSTVHGRPVSAGTADAPAVQTAWQLPIGAFGAWSYAVESWSVGDQLILATDIDVVARDRATGAEKWRAEVPKVEGQSGKQTFCGASTSPVGGIVIVVYGVRDPRSTSPVCFTVAALDVRTGKFMWQNKLRVRPTVRYESQRPRSSVTQP